MYDIIMECMRCIGIIVSLIEYCKIVVGLWSIKESNVMTQNLSTWPMYDLKKDIIVGHASLYYN